MLRVEAIDAYYGNDPLAKNLLPFDLPESYVEQMQAVRVAEIASAGDRRLQIHRARRLRARRGLRHCGKVWLMRQGIEEAEVRLTAHLMISLTSGSVLPTRRRRRLRPRKDEPTMTGLY